MTCPAYKTETVTREVFNPDVCNTSGFNIGLVHPNGDMIGFSAISGTAASSGAAAIRDWLKAHIDADRLARKAQQ